MVGAARVPTSAPSAQGVDPSGVAAFLDALEDDPRVEPHSLIIQRHGHRIVEASWAPHRLDDVRLVYSLSKTFTGSALALQLGEGRLGLDDLAVDHFPAELEGADDRMRRLRIRHLASMATGHDQETLLDALLAAPDDVVGAFFRIPPAYEPGTRFAYNQPPVLAIATLLQRLAGERLTEYLRPRLLDPMGIADFRWSRYGTVDLGFSGVFTTVDAIARLGQLHLDDGVWDGRRILPEGWVAQASSVQVENPNEPEPDWRQGYGFQLWMCRHGFRGDGAFGQYMVVLPEQDAVVAFLSGTEEMQSVLDHLWRLLLPAFGSSRADGEGDDELAARLAGLRLPTVAERIGGAPPRGVEGAFRRGDGASHPTITGVDVLGDTLVLQEGDASMRVPLSEGWTPVVDAPASASAALDGAGRLIVDLVLTATPHRIEITVDPGQATFRAEWPAVPLFGVGVEAPITSMRPPD